MIERRGPRPEALVGPGSGRELLEGALRGPGGAAPYLVVDARLGELAEQAGDAAGVHLVGRPADPDGACELANLIAVSGARSIVAVGGGNVLDLAKLAATEVANPRFVRAVAARGVRQGFVSGLALRAAALPISVVPTTIGTGSESNGSACFESLVHGRTVKTLVATELTPTTVAYDPDFTKAPSGLRRAGVLEIGARLVGAAVGSPSTLHLAEQEAENAFGRLVELVERHGADLDDPDARTEAAVLSGDSHSGWALRGRGPAPSPLWLVATALSVAAGISKNEATGRLVGPWLTRVAAGEERWGSREAAARWSRITGRHGGRRSLGEWFAAVTEGTEQRGRPGDVDAGEVASRILTRFRIGSLARIEADAVRALVDDSLLEWVP